MKQLRIMSQKHLVNSHLLALYIWSVNTSIKELSVALLSNFQGGKFLRLLAGLLHVQGDELLS